MAGLVRGLPFFTPRPGRLRHPRVANFGHLTSLLPFRCRSRGVLHHCPPLLHRLPGHPPQRPCSSPFLNGTQLFHGCGGASWCLRTTSLTAQVWSRSCCCSCFYLYACRQPCLPLFALRALGLISSPWGHLWPRGGVGLLYFRIVVPNLFAPMVGASPSGHWFSAVRRRCSGRCRGLLAVLRRRAYLSSAPLPLRSHPAVCWHPHMTHFTDVLEGDCCSPTAPSRSRFSTFAAVTESPPAQSYAAAHFHASLVIVLWGRRSRSCLEITTSYVSRV